MNCRSCNTRLPHGAKVCPNCGHSERAEGLIDGTGGAAPETESEAISPLSPSSCTPRVERVGEDDAGIELRDEVELSLEAAMLRPESASDGESRAPHRADSAACPPPSAPSQPTFPLALESPQLAQLLVEQPELLEPGLGIYVDESGAEVGARYATEVGEIDLLARDQSGAVVVVMVAGSESAQAMISAMLQRLGWVRKHLLKNEQSVRGILVLERMDKEIGYAAAAVSDSIDFKTWRLSLSFEHLEF